MRQLVPIAIATVALIACGGGRSAAAAAPQGAGGQGNEFVLRESEAAARGAQGAKGSKIKPTRTEAAMRFVVVEKDKGPVKGVVIVLTAEGGNRYYTEETDAEGQAEVLVPVGQKYELTYLSLGRKDIAASVSVSNEPNQNVKLTLRFKRQPPPPPFVLKGVTFDTGKATIRAESFPRLDIIVEFMRLKKSARIEIAGHTDNVGNPRTNKVLSEKRAQACRAYVISKGIDGSRITAVGHGDQRPVAGNDTEEGRQDNRRIEATEL